MSDDQLADGVGAAVKAMRVDRGLSTRALAALAGISQPLLSNVENGRALPSVQTLYALAEALGTSPAELLPGPTERAGAAHADGHRLSLPVDDDAATGIATRLVHAAPGRRLEAYLIEQRAGTSDPAPFQHSGEDVIHVLAGRLTLHVGDTAVSLAAGDTATIDGTSPHWFRTPRGSAATVMIITARAHR